MWGDQIQICIDNDDMGTALDVFRLCIAEANMVGTDVTKWGDMKPSDLAKEQGEHKANKPTDVSDMWKHQDRMHGDCRGMSVVRDTIELAMNVEKLEGVQPSRASCNRTW